MHTMLILRSEIICLVILTFFLTYYFHYSMYDRKKHYLRMNLYALGHVIFDIITVFTVNHLNEVPSWMNRICHGLFYMFAIMFCYEFFCYVVHMTYAGTNEKKITIIALFLPALYAVLIPVLRIDYLKGNGTNYSFGPCVYVGYSIAMLFFFAGLIMVIWNRRKLADHMQRALLPMLIFMALAVLIQVIVPELLLTGADVTLITVGAYFAIENPAEKFRIHAYLDLNTQLKNRNCFNMDLKKLDEEYFGENIEGKIACIMCDMNSLKEINDLYGHSTGDQYLRKLAQTLRDQLVSAYGVYRIGGDEFAAIYLDCDLETIERELEAVKADCAAFNIEETHPLSAAMGCAVARIGETIHDVTIRADHEMYNEKRIMKGDQK